MHYRLEIITGMICRFKNKKIVQFFWYYIIKHDSNVTISVLPLMFMNHAERMSNFMSYNAWSSPTHNIHRLLVFNSPNI